MSTRERRRSQSSDAEIYDDEFGLVTDDDIVAYMAEQELEEQAEAEKKEGFWNLQTASGMGLIGLGALYSLQQIGWLPFGADLSGLVTLLPILASILIILTGFGVLSWSPAARRRRKARRRAARQRRRDRSEARKTMGRRAPSDEAGLRASRAFEQAEQGLRAASRAAERATSEAFARRAKAREAGHRRLTKDRRNRKLTGVAAGMANYFGLDPTVVRIGWVVATIFSQGAALLPYILLSIILSNDEDVDGDDPFIQIRVSDD